MYWIISVLLVEIMILDPRYHEVLRDTGLDYQVLSFIFTSFNAVFLCSLLFHFNKQAICQKANSVGAKLSQTTDGQLKWMICDINAPE